MFYAKFAINGVEHCKLYFDHAEYMSDTFSPETEYITVIDFVIHGNNYRTRKESLRDTAVYWSNNGDTAGLYMSDLCHIGDWFYKNGKRYGLLEELRENGLC